jgi:hypothetical protein
VLVETRDSVVLREATMEVAFALILVTIVWWAGKEGKVHSKRSAEAGSMAPKRIVSWPYDE